MDEKEVSALVEEGSRYVEEYFQFGKGKRVDAELVSEIIDVYNDYLKLIKVLEVNE
jgi:hypothetical protein